ncbi:MAG: asparagine synthase (glutamine-hydrolyzing) [Planctomycetes bacterium]|nr:asparagine synthase (glutamine-hydrolyzing) [Planctomycetota bacterium]
MCGILGIVAEPGRSVDLRTPQIVAMRDRMEMRGPDDAGLFAARNVVLAHRRLAIRDLDGGKQPWLTPDEQSVLVYNGELYNDGQLRSDLERRGHRFRSRCDTEVVMQAYREWGVDCVDRFRGMFAFAIYDFRDDSLFLVRDRFGIKPLFLMSLGGTLVFASSIAALLAHPGFSPKPNWSTISHYLTTFRLTLGRATVYEGIQQLLPGERLQWKAGGVRIDRYWDYPQEDEDAPEFAEAVDEFETQLRQSVSVRLVSDVPVGMFLSGGVDSNTLACLVSGLRGKTRTAGHCGGGVDATNSEQSDFSAAQKCANWVGFDFHETRVSPHEYWERWQWMLRQQATPLSTPTDVILYLLSLDAKRNAGVVLGGEGADELLCGYAVPHYCGNDFDRLHAGNTGHWPGTAEEFSAFRESLRRQYGRDQFSSATDHYFAANSLIPTAVKARLFQPRIWQEADEDARMFGTYSQLLESSDRKDTVLQTARRQMKLLHRVNLEALLSRLDSATMPAGLEARVPFTDHELVERVFRLPQRYRLDVDPSEANPHLSSAQLAQRGSLRSKRLLRSVADRLMPQDLARRKKASFPTPVAKWLAHDWSHAVRERIRSSEFARAVFRPDALNALTENLTQSGMWLWPILNILTWGDEQFGGRGVTSIPSTVCPSAKPRRIA